MSEMNERLMENIRTGIRGTSRAILKRFPDADGEDMADDLAGIWAKCSELHMGDDIVVPDPPDPPPIEPDPPGNVDPQPPGLPFEDAVFAAGGRFGWLDDFELDLEGAEVVDEFVRAIVNGGWRSDKVFPAPAEWSNKNYLGNNVRSPGGDYGPHWYGRPWNLTGDLRNVTAQRMGRWDGGGTGEGHGLYADVIGPFTLEDFTAIQCGGQAVQLTQYANPTYSLFPFDDPAQFDNGAHTVALRRVVARNCGLLHAKPREDGTPGGPGRGAWAFSYFNPGQSLVVEDCEVHTNHAVRFLDPNRGWCSSTGALICTPGKPSPIPGVSGAWGVPNLRLLNFKARLGKPDREDVRLVKVAAAQIIDLDLARVDDSGLPELSLFDNCGTIEVLNPKAPVAVQPRYASTKKPKGPAIVLQAGEDRTFQMS